MSPTQISSRALAGNFMLVMRLICLHNDDCTAAQDTEGQAAAKAIIVRAKIPTVLNRFWIWPMCIQQ